jgi:hypothetical protein
MCSDGVPHPIDDCRCCVLFMIELCTCRWLLKRSVCCQQEKLAEAEARVAELSQQLQQLQVEKVRLAAS